jgi:hypothetical protein
MPTDPHHKDEQLARQGRLIALVIAGTTLLWMAAQWVAVSMELSLRVLFLFDLAALAAFIWALVVGLQIWRKRRES